MNHRRFSADDTLNGAALAPAWLYRPMHRLMLDPPSLLIGFGVGTLLVGALAILVLRQVITRGGV